MHILGESNLANHGYKSFSITCKHIRANTNWKMKKYAVIVSMAQEQTLRFREFCIFETRSIIHMFLK